MKQASRAWRFSGSPRARGRAHGEALSADLGRLLAAWRQEIRGEVGMELEPYVAGFLAGTDFVSAVRKFTPELYQEVEGIAEGAELPFELCFCLQLMDEQWEDVECRGRGEGAQCSCLALFDRAEGEPNLLAQNMDLPKYLDGFQQVMHLVDEAMELEALVLSYPGFLGLFGLNSRGVGVCVNNLSQLNAAPSGLPVAFVIRGALACRTLEDAVHFVSSVPHAGGQSYLIGGAEGVVNLECSAGRVVRVQPAGPGYRCHTNHPLENDDLEATHLDWAEDEEEADAAFGRTFTRLAMLREALAGGRPMGVHDVEVLLSDRPGFICRPVDGPFEVFTFGSGVLELSPTHPRAHFARRSPTAAAYATYEFTRELRPRKGRAAK